MEKLVFLVEDISPFSHFIVIQTGNFSGLSRAKFLQGLAGLMAELVSVVSAQLIVSPTAVNSTAVFFSFFVLRPHFSVPAIVYRFKFYFKVYFQIWVFLGEYSGIFKNYRMIYG